MELGCSPRTKSFPVVAAQWLLPENREDVDWIFNNVFGGDGFEDVSASDGLYMYDYGKTMNEYLLQIAKNNNCHPCLLMPLEAGTYGRDGIYLNMEETKEFMESCILICIKANSVLKKMKRDGHFVNASGLETLNSIASDLFTRLTSQKSVLQKMFL